MFDCLTKARSIACAIAGLLVVAAAPAQAEDAALVPATQAPAAGNPVNAQGNDRQFQQLFASWEALDEGRNLAATSVSVPSRMPLDGARMSSDYGMRDHPVLRRRANHKGVDLAAPEGTPIYATADGIVGRADWFSSYGLYVQIDHGADLETRYAHMSRLAVAAGERVRKGDIIGYVGSTGRSTGPHLHYEVRVAGQAVNPVPYMHDHGNAPVLALAEEGGRGGE